MKNEVPELKRPAMEVGEPMPGRFVRAVGRGYEGTGRAGQAVTEGVYHGVYLPVDWERGKRYPVIVEYAGNEWVGVCTGRVEDCRLGFYLSGGRGAIWVVLPFVDEKRGCNALTWWGDEEATARYCRENVRRVCAEYGGDERRVLLTGFSRGAIACGYIGLHDEATAGLWAGFLADAHFDGVQFTVAGARERLARVRGRPVLIVFGEKDVEGKANSLIAAGILRELGEEPTVVEIAGVGHSDLWVEEECEARRRAQEWVRGVTGDKVKG